MNSKRPCWRHRVKPETLPRCVLLHASCFLKSAEVSGVNISNVCQLPVKKEPLRRLVLIADDKRDDGDVLLPLHRNRTMTDYYLDGLFSWNTFRYETNNWKETHLLSRSQDKAFLTGVPVGLLVVVVGPGCSGRAGQGLDSRSSLGSGMLPMPVEALPTEWFLRWLNSDMLEEREWPVLYPEGEGNDL